MSLTAAGTVVATVSRNRAHAAERVRALYRAWYREVRLVASACRAGSSRLTRADPRALVPRPCRHRGL